MAHRHCCRDHISALRSSCLCLILRTGTFGAPSKGWRVCTEDGEMCGCSHRTHQPNGHKRRGRGKISMWTRPAMPQSLMGLAALYTNLNLDDLNWALSDTVISEPRLVDNGPHSFTHAWNARTILSVQDRSSLLNTERDWLCQVTGLAPAHLETDNV